MWTPSFLVGRRRERLTSRYLFIVAALAVRCYAGCDPCNACSDLLAASGPRDILLRCLDSQRAIRRVSMHLTTEIRRSRPPGDWRSCKQRGELSIRRDGDRIDISEKHLFLDWPGHDFFSRTVVDSEYFVYYEHPLGKGQKPEGGLAAKRRKKEFFQRFGENLNSGSPLDGYLLGTANNSVAEALLEAPDLRVRGQDDLDGVRCEVVEGHSIYGRVVMWLAPARGSVALKYISERAGDDLWLENKSVSRQRKTSYPAGERRVLRVEERLEGVEVREMSGRYVPVRGTYTETRFLDHNEVDSSTYHYARSNITLDPDFTGTQAFRSDLPEGTTVTLLDAPEGSGVVYRWENNKAVPVFEEPPPGHVWMAVPSHGRLLQLVLVNVLVAISLLCVYLRRRITKSNRRDPSSPG